MFSWKWNTTKEGGTGMGKLKFRVTRKGEVHVEGEGFKGPVCLEKSDKILQGLGKKTKEELKPEYYEQAGVELTVSS
jgi:hypothetical protein